MQTAKWLYWLILFLMQVNHRSTAKHSTHLHASVLKMVGLHVY
jgi:hypothetical protein